MGKKAFYLEMLKKYIDNQGQAPAQIRQSLDLEDYETAERMAHTAKGGQREHWRFAGASIG